MTCIENERVAELKTKAAELSQIIEEGHLAHASSTKGEDNLLRSSHYSVPTYTVNSNSKSMHNQSEIVQQHDVTSSFLRQEEKYAGANQNQAMERD